MEEDIKYCYDDWWLGEICLIMATLEYNLNEVRTAPTIVTWLDFTEEAITRIKEKQKEIYWQEVEKTANHWREIFLTQLSNSQIKELFLSDEIEQCKQILFQEFGFSENVLINKNWHILFTRFRIQSIQNFFDRYIKKGETLNYDFIHSPICIYQNKNLIQDEVFAQACWIHYKWLLNFGKDDSLLIDKLGDAKINASFNPFPAIFKNGAAYQMFMELRTNTLKEKSKVSDYGYIFHKIKEKPVDGIIKKMPHQTFIEFLNENFSAKLKVRKLPPKDPAFKKDYYFAALKNYEKALSLKDK